MKKLIMLLVLTSFTSIAAADETKLKQIFNDLKQKDSQLFNHIYGQCVIEKLEVLIAEDFEFYHDKGGLTASKKDFMAMAKRGPCAEKKMPSEYKSFRVLNEGSFKSFPMYKAGKLYAVLQTGEHSFYESYKGNNLVLTSTAKFSDLWVLTNDKWKIGRVFSYDHINPSK